MTATGLKFLPFSPEDKEQSKRITSSINEKRKGRQPTYVVGVKDASRDTLIIRMQMVKLNHDSHVVWQIDLGDDMYTQGIKKASSYD